MSGRLIFAFALGLFTGIVATITIFRANHTFPNMEECLHVVDKSLHDGSMNIAERNAIVAIVWAHIAECLGVK
jgi:hypothetical protein